MSFRTPNEIELLKALGQALNGDEWAVQDARAVYLFYSMQPTPSPFSPENKAALREQFRPSLSGPVAPEDMEKRPEGYRFGAIEVFPEPQKPIIIEP